MLRYVCPQAPGVTLCLGTDQPSPQRTLFEHLLSAAHPVELHVPSLAQALALPLKAVAQALFDLTRLDAISVQTGVLDALAAQAHSDTRPAVPGCLATLQRAVRACCAPGQQAVLASAEGFCLTHVAAPPVLADQLAAGAAQARHLSGWTVTPLHLRHFSGCLLLTRPLPPTDPAWLGLGRSLGGLSRALGAKN